MWKLGQADDFDVAAVIAGEASGPIHDIAPVRDVMARVVAEAEARRAAWRAPVAREVAVLTR